MEALHQTIQELLPLDSNLKELGNVITDNSHTG